MIDLVVQNVSGLGASCPNAEQFKQWASQLPADGEVCLRIVDEDEMCQLNHDYRGKTGPTNVLSFAMSLPEGVPMNCLGDVVVCAPVVQREANEQGKSERAHWAHLFVHGLLHLLGHDHIDDSEAEQMEGLEVEWLGKLGFDNPYTAS